MRKIWLSLLLLVLLSGCWDERLLKEHTLILSIGYDREDEDRLKQTVTFPSESSEGGGSSEVTSKYNHITVTGDTIRDTDTKMDRFAPKTFDRSKAKIILFGEELAKEGVFTTLDSIYRDLRGPLNAVMAIVDGEAEEALTTKNNYKMLISEFYLDLLHSASKVGLTKAENVQDICPFILTQGKDVAVPYIKLDENGRVADILGLALFFNDKMSGKLLGQDATIYLILMNEASKRTKVNVKIFENEDEYEKNYVDFALRKMKRKMDVHVKNGKINVSLKYTLSIQIDEFTKGGLQSEATAKDVEKRIAEKLTEKSKRVLKQMQEVNHDGLGIGQHVKAFHHRTWEAVDWVETYPNITIDPSFEVNMMTHGIIN